ncbi:MAG TPA: MaoC family dehydratase [Candidatus Elarobacter sp.]|nr:MaoC family dehydratase [Dongiaceae bacterium]HZW54517.1 MaoC family dehydratase [Candidatus Elarobacter sp.]
MQRAVFSGVADLERLRGERAGESSWITVTQQLVDEFARVTRDPQWIHVDVERARHESPTGTTIAHGFLTLSLLSRMIAEVVSFPTARMSLNYGFDRVRFVAPVPVGSEIRGAFAVEDVKPVGGGAHVTWRADVEIRGAAKPALTALWLARVLFAETAPAT